MAIPPTTLLELADELQALCDGAKQAAQQELKDAQVALAAAKGEQGQAGHAKQLAQTQKELAALRAQAAATRDKPDADALWERIAELEVVERRQLAALLDDGDRAALVGARADAASAFLAAVTKRAAALPAEKKAAEAEKKLRDGWKAAAIHPPLDSLGGKDGAAARLLKGEAVAKVTKRITDELKDERVDESPLPGVQAPAHQAAEGAQEPAAEGGAEPAPAGESANAPAGEPAGEPDSVPGGVSGYEAADTAADAAKGAPAEPQDDLFKLYRAAVAGREVERERWKDADTARKDAQKRLDDERTAGGGPDGAVAVLRAALARADAELREWAEHARQRYAAAAAQLQALVDGGTLLTPAEHNALVDAKKEGSRAAALREKREAARHELLTAKAARDEAVADARAKAPWAADVSDDPAVKTAEASLAEKQKAYDRAADNYKAADQAAYGGWSGNVPEAAWRKVAGFVEAKATLADLSGSTGDKLVQYDETAEQQLAATLWEAEKHALRAAFLSAQIALQSAVLDRAAPTRPARLLAALRGDA